jgi:hypothetical protein
VASGDLCVGNFPYVYNVHGFTCLLSEDETSERVKHPKRELNINEM